MKSPRRYSLDLDSNNHSVFKLHAHLILCVKYRRQVITDERADFLIDCMHRLGERYRVTVIEANHDKDHLHVLLSFHPNTPLSSFLNAYKSASSRLVKKQYPAIRQRLWKEMFWSQSYCLLTVGGASLDVVRAYIESQGEGPCTSPAKSP